MTFWDTVLAVMVGTFLYKLVRGILLGVLGYLAWALSEEDR
jgi:hypothetical protein